VSVNYKDFFPAQATDWPARCVFHAADRAAFRNDFYPLCGSTNLRARSPPDGDGGTSITSLTAHTHVMFGALEFESRIPRCAYC